MIRKLLGLLAAVAAATFVVSAYAEDKAKTVEG